MKKAFPHENSMGFRALPFQIFAGLSLLVLSTSACIVVSHRVDAVAIERRDGIDVASPVKIHLTDGSTGLYAEGVTISDGSLRGKGIFYDIMLLPFPANPVLTPIPLDSIAAMETFRNRVNQGKTAAFLPVSIIGSVAAAGTGVGGTVNTGTTLDKFPIARSAEGALVQIRTNKGIARGESIAVQDDGIIVLSPMLPGRPIRLDSRRPKLRLFQFNTILALEFESLSPPQKMAKRRPLRPVDLEHLKGLSRFPQGLSPDLLRQLLLIHGQTALAPGID